VSAPLPERLGIGPDLRTDLCDPTDGRVVAFALDDDGALAAEIAKRWNEYHDVTHREVLLVGALRKCLTQLERATTSECFDTKCHDDDCPKVRAILTARAALRETEGELA